jgi:putative (di)nucleoside polyphosphate hydrolase
MNFRKAVGAIILDFDAGGLVVFQRTDFPESWQCPEGGIEVGEAPEEAVVRELEEEIGLRAENFEILKKTRDFIRYDYGKKVTLNGFDGQEKQFFLVRLRKPATELEFKYDSVTEEVEFSNYRVVRKDELVNLLPKFKVDLYRKVLAEFKL